MDSQQKKSILLNFISLAFVATTGYIISNLAAIFMKKKDYIEPFLDKYLLKKIKPIGKTKVLGLSCEIKMREISVLKNDLMTSCKTPFDKTISFYHSPNLDFRWVEKGVQKAIEISKEFSLHNPLNADIDIVIYDNRFFVPPGTHNNLIRPQKHVVVVNANPDISAEIVLFHELIHVVQAESKKIFENTTQLMNNIDEFIVINESTARAMELFAYNNYALTPDSHYKHAPKFVALVNRCGKEAITPYFKERHFNKDVASNLAKRAPACDEEIKIKRELEKYRTN